MGASAENGLIPARFLTLVAHLVIIIVVLFSREENILACMPIDYTPEQFEVKDTQLVIGLITSLALIGIELFGFLSGISMFMTTVAAISTVCHGIGSMLLSLAVLDAWDCRLFWWIFALCSVFPAAVELAITCMLLTLHRKLICQKFIRAGTVGETSAFPFVAGFLSCSLWLRYGFFLGDNSLILVNTVGASLQFAYVVVYSMYSARKIAVLRQFVAIAGILLIILAYMQQQTDDVTAKLHLGLICCTVTIIFFAAPLTMLAHVIRVKSAESLPFSLIVANLIVSAEWLLYGIVIDDPFVMITNALGCILSGMQLLLFALYPSNPMKKGFIQVR